MLIPEPAIEVGAVEGRIGLALAGGGPLGAFYELGTLHALGEAIEGLQLDELHAYVGVSSGSLLAACLANGLSTAELGRIIVTTESTQYPLTANQFLRPALGEFVRRAAKLPVALLAGLWRYARNPLRYGLVESLNPLTHSIPTGLFDNRVIGDFLHALFSAPGRTDDFRELRHRLFVVATELNTGQSVRFGTARYDHVPISSAVQASTALPGLFPPVRIEDRAYVDGALRRTMNASLALDAGAELVICINPLIPYDATGSSAQSPERADLVEGGLPLVLSQTFRALIQSRMEVGMAKYSSLYPRADMLLFQPDKNDEAMFFANVFSYADRQSIVDHAYQMTRRDLRAHASAVRPILQRYDLDLRDDVLADDRRSFATQLDRDRQRARLSELHNRLDETLGELSALLEPDSRRRRPTTD